MEESFGAMLTRIRLARGWSQLRVAERLCAASGVATVTRNELSFRTTATRPAATPRCSPACPGTDEAEAQRAGFLRAGPPYPDFQTVAGAASCDGACAPAALPFTGTSTRRMSP